MKQLIIFQILLLSSCMVTNAQIKLIEHYDINSCKYKIDTFSKNLITGISFLDCSGNRLNVDYSNVDTLPKNINHEWNLMLNTEISKLTQKDVYIFLIYGIVINQKGQVSNIEKLSKTTYDILIEGRVIELIKKSKWKPAIKEGKAINYYFSFPIKIDLT